MFAARFIQPQTGVTKKTYRNMAQYLMYIVYLFIVRGYWFKKTFLIPGGRFYYLPSAYKAQIRWGFIY